MKHSPALHHRARRAALAAAAAAAVITGLLPGAATGPAQAAGAAGAPLVSAPAGDTVPGAYVVALDGPPAATSAAAHSRFEAVLAAAQGLGVQVQHRYTHAVSGFSADLSAGQLAAVRRLPGVRYVSPVGRVESPTVQTPVPNWGLDRIDQRTLPLDGAYHYTADGTGVTAYLLDTGLHPLAEFGSRIVPGVNVSLDGRAGTDTDDYCGHGTWVAGILGSTSYGVAKGVSLLPVRVRACSETGTDDIIAGVDWVTDHHTARPGPALALLEAISGWQDPVFLTAVQNSMDSGISYIVPAGNDGVDACGWAPLSLPDVVGVGATDSTDTVAGYSNRGSCVDLFAPGSAITSTSRQGDGLTETSYGTSGSAPFAAGVAAQYLQLHPAATHQQVQQALLAAATPGVLHVSDSSSPNLLLSSELSAPAPSLAAQYGNLAPGAPSDNAIQADLRVRNTGSLPVDLSKVTLRYWFSRDGGASSYGVACDWAQLGCPKLTQRVVTLPTARPGADAYLEVGFTAAAGSLAAGGNTGAAQLRWNKTDWSAFSETNDYSYRSSATVGDSMKVTGYYQGQLVWGTEP